MFRAIFSKATLVALCILVLAGARGDSQSTDAPSMSISRFVTQAYRGGSSPLLPDSIMTKSSVWELQDNIWVYDAPNFHRRNVAEGIDPTLSPDGSMIAYCGFAPGAPRSQLMIVKSDGSDQRRLTNLDGSPCTPAWSRDGKKIAFTVESKEGQAVMVLDFEHKTITPVALGNLPRWSTDGKKLLFLRKPEAHGATASIWIANSNGEHAKLVVDTYAPMPSAVWAGDGKSIVYTNDDQHRSAIFRVNLDGSNPQKIAGDKNLEMYYPSISPDGKKLSVVIVDGKTLMFMEIDVETQKSRWLANNVAHGEAVWVKSH